MASVLLRSAMRMPGASSFTQQSALQYSTTSYRSSNGVLGSVVIIAGAALLGALADDRAKADTVDYNKVREDIAALLEKEDYDDGSYGPILVRLAWHASGTFDKKTCTGGSDGATMRFCPEKHHGANAGLQVARDVLEPIKAKYPTLSYADLWTLAGVVAIEEAGGPRVAWRPGRSDKPDGSYCPPDGRLPDASQGADHIRNVFGRMGFDDREMVALIGAHAMGRCHPDRSGFDGPWTKAPTVFSNSFFTELFDQNWTPREWSGPHQFRDESGELMMLPADLALRDDPAFNKWAKLYAENEEQFFADFSGAFAKLLELGAKDLGRSSVPRK